MNPIIWPAFFAAFALVCPHLRAQAPVPFDAAPFGGPLEDGQGVMWNDPREIHEVTVDFADAVPAGIALRLEYWGSHWPAQHLPKNREQRRPHDEKCV